MPKLIAVQQLGTVISMTLSQHSSVKSIVDECCSFVEFSYSSKVAESFRTSLAKYQEENCIPTDQAEVKKLLYSLLSESEVFAEQDLLDVEVVFASD